MTLHNMLGDLSTDEAVDWLAQLVQHLGVLSAVRAPDGTLRVAIASGTLPAVTTVSTVTNQTQAGGYSLAGQVMAGTNSAAVAGNIANVIVS